MTINRDALMALLQEKFPKMWMKESEQFDGTKNAIWTGEGSMDNEDFPLFNYGTDNTMYTMGIRKELFELLEDNGWYCEWQDAGTIFIFED